MARTVTLLRGTDSTGLVHFADPMHSTNINPRWAWCETLHHQIIGIDRNSVGDDDPTTCFMCVILEQRHEPSKLR